MTDEKSALARDFDQLQNEKTAALNDASENVTALEKAREVADMQITDLTKDKADLAQKLDKLSEDKLKVEEGHANVISSMTTEKANLDRQIEGLNHAIEGLNQQIEVLITKTTEEKDSLGVEIGKLREDKTNLGRKVDRLQSESVATVEKHRGEIKDLQDRIDAAEEDKSRLQTDMESSTRQL